MQVAKYLEVPPWELVDKPRFWLHVGTVCMLAEAKHQEKQQQKAQQRAKQRGGR